MEEIWKLTEVKNEKYPNRKYFISNIGRIKWKEGSKEYLHFDPKKSSSKASNSGYKTYINRKDFSVKKLLYCTFNNLPYKGKYLIKFKDGNKKNLSSNNLYDVYSENNMGYKEILNKEIKKAKPILTYKGEKWVEMGKINSLDKDSNYYISSNGQICKYSYTTKDYTLLNCCSRLGYGKHGSYEYDTLGISKRTLRVHKLVLCYFSHTPYTTHLHVHHINGIKNDNRLDNLMFVTPQEHAEIERDKRKQGHLNKRKFSWEEILDMREMYNNGCSISGIQDKYKESGHGTIRQIVKNITYKDE